MKYTVARLVFVIAAAAVVGVFIALVVYFTLLAALIFLVLTAAVAIGLKLNARKRTQGALAAAPVQRLTKPGASGRTNSARDEEKG